MKFYFLILLFLLAVSTCFSENYAILISGDRDTQKTSLPKTYMASDDSWPEFWHDEFLMWETLYNLGFKDENTNLPTKFSLKHNYPNPFNPVTKIKFDLPENSQVNLLVYNSRGQIVATLLNDHLEAGRHTIDFNAAHLPSGVYFYRISAGKFTDVKRMLVIK